MSIEAHNVRASDAAYQVKRKSIKTNFTEKLLPSVSEHTKLDSSCSGCRGPSMADPLGTTGNSDLGNGPTVA